MVVAVLRSLEDLPVEFQPSFDGRNRRLSGTGFRSRMGISVQSRELIRHRDRSPGQVGYLDDPIQEPGRDAGGRFVGLGEDHRPVEVCRCQALTTDLDGGPRHREADGHLVCDQSESAFDPDAVVAGEEEKAAHGHRVTVAGDDHRCRVLEEPEREQETLLEHAGRVRPTERSTLRSNPPEKIPVRPVSTTTAPSAVA